MALRPFAFGVRFRHQGRTIRVRGAERTGYRVEDSRSGRNTRHREHASLTGALRDFASTWRGRLH